MSARFRVATVLWGWVLAATSPAWGDVVELRDGTTVEGRFLGGTGAQVRIEVDGTPRWIRTAEIRTLTFGPIGAVEPCRPDPTTEARARRVEIPAGTRVSVAPEEAVDARRAVRGQVFAVRLVRPLTGRGRDFDGETTIVAPAGAEARVRVVDLDDGATSDTARLVVELVELDIGGVFVPASSAPLEIGTDTVSDRDLAGGVDWNAGVPVTLTLDTPLAVTVLD